MTSQYAASLSLSKETRPIRGKGLDFSHIIIILAFHRLVLGLPRLTAIQICLIRGILEWITGSAYTTFVGSC